MRGTSRSLHQSPWGLAPPCQEAGRLSLVPLLPREGVRCHEGGRDDLRLGDRKRSLERPLLQGLKPLQVPTELKLELRAPGCASEDCVQIPDPLLEPWNAGACSAVLVASLPGYADLAEVVGPEVLQLGGTSKRCLALGRMRFSSVSVLSPVVNSMT